MILYNRTLFSICLLFILPVFLLGCTILPASGPFSQKMKDRAAFKVRTDIKHHQKADFRYALVDITNPVTRYLSSLAKSYTDVGGWPINQNPKDVRIAVNDTVEVTIYESQSGGLFIPVEAGVRPGNFVRIPAQQIDKSGVIDIPFAGKISVVGRTASDIAQEISKRLGNRAIEPQTVVSIINRGGSEVSVIGEVTNASRFSLSLNGDKILDSIARAGGPTVPGYEAWVSLQRKSYEWTAPFDLLVLDPEKNVYLHPGDTVYVYREPETFQMFGASGFNGTYPFTRRRMTLAEALGEARGLNDAQADPAEIYLYRKEKRTRLDRMALHLEFPDDVTTAYTETVPVVYRLDLRDPDGFFLSQSFPIEHRDIIYIANAESVEFSKFLDLLGLSSGTKISTQQAVEQ